MRDRQDVILGAGLAGLTAAYRFRELGEDHWRVYEREERVGGHARSIVVDGYVFDYGPHVLFTVDAEIGALIRDLLGDNFTEQAREAFIYHHAFGTYTRFPFQAHLHGLPRALIVECIVGLVRAVERQARGEFKPENYEEWMRGFFGDAIAERLLIPYARKLWTVEPSVMDFNWIGRRVPTPDVERIVAGALSDDVAQTGATASFWYPKHGGIEALPRALGDRVPGVHLGRTLERIELPERRLVFDDGEVVAYDQAIYTLPLCHLERLVRGLPARVRRACQGLRFQGIYCVNVGIDRADISDKHWVYFYEDGFPFHRLSFPRNFSTRNVPEGKGSISTEVSFSPGRPPEKDVVVADTIRALHRAKILSDDDRIEVVHTEEVAPAYVIYDLDHARNVEAIRAWLEEHGIVVAGRFGAWQYLNMDHAMRSGREAADAIAQTRRKVVPLRAFRSKG
jgi:UDP-galactopyranose mutase